MENYRSAMFSRRRITLCMVNQRVTGQTFQSNSEPLPMRDYSPTSINVPVLRKHVLGSERPMLKEYRVTSCQQPSNSRYHQLSCQYCWWGIWRKIFFSFARSLSMAETCFRRNWTTLALWKKRKRCCSWDTTGWFCLSIALGMPTPPSFSPSSYTLDALYRSLC